MEEKSQLSISNRQRLAPKGSTIIRPFMTRGPVVALIDSDLKFCSAMTKLAENHEIAFSCFWKSDILVNTPATHFNVLIISEEEWNRLHRTHPKAVPHFSDVRWIILKSNKVDSLKPLETPTLLPTLANSVQWLDRTIGAEAVLSAALGTEHHGHHTTLIH